MMLAESAEVLRRDRVFVWLKKGNMDNQILKFETIAAATELTSYPSNNAPTCRRDNTSRQVTLYL